MTYYDLLPVLRGILLFILIFFTSCDDIQPANFDNEPVSSDEGQVIILNPGFENGSSDWEFINSEIITDNSYTGLQSIRVFDSTSIFKQNISVGAHTEYKLSAYLDGQGIIGIVVGDEDYNICGVNNKWGETSVTFNSGDETTIVIYGSYHGVTGIFDDFSLSTRVSLQTIDVSASSFFDSKIAENTIDEDTLTWWSAQGMGEYVTYELAENFEVTGVAISWYNELGKSYDFEISTGISIDALTKVYAGVSDGGASEVETYSFEGVSAKHLRITGFGNSSGDEQISIQETKIFGHSKSCSDLMIIANTVPSDLMINCRQWKINYPNGIEDKTLCEEKNNEYFYVNEDGNGIVFRAPIRSDNGTTPNSSYIRSELREREEDGSADVYWTTSGKHLVYVKQRITHLPIVKDHLVATQVHGDKSAGIDDAMVMRLEDSHLFLSFNGGKLRDDLTVKRGYELGTLHEVIFEIVNGKHYCYYSEDGNLSTAYLNGNANSYLIKDGNQDFVMDLDYDRSYFKIGNYTQSNADKEGSYANDPDNYGEVIVYDFWIQHD